MLQNTRVDFGSILIAFGKAYNKKIVQNIVDLDNIEPLNAKEKMTDTITKKVS